MKRLLCIGVLLFMFFSLAACKDNYKYKEGDFSFNITVDKTEARIGDKIKISATLTNLSGKNIRIQMPHTDYSKLEDMILIGFFNENQKHEFVVNSKGGSRKKIIIKKDMSINRTMELTIDELYHHYDVCASLLFYIGKGYKNAISINSNVKTIMIKE